MRIVLWGTYDLGKPRVRLMRRALHELGDVEEIHADIWSGVEDKSQVSRLAAKLGFALKMMAAYPGLLWRYLRAAPHDVVVVGYMGQFDVLVLCALARLRGKPIVWDAFLSLYDTVVADRRLVSRKSMLARALYAIEWLACRAASRIVLDTRAHAAFFETTYRIRRDKLGAVFVGAETEAFPPQPERAAGDGPLTILFYGQFIPLHGIETIVAAAQASAERPWRWRLIGDGQDAAKIRALIDEGECANIDWTPWVDYDDLIAEIRQADICLGVFGASDKAARVIPNKVFQILAAGRALITRDGPGVRELLSPADAHVWLTAPADAGALVAAVADAETQMRTLNAPGAALHARARARFSLSALATDWGAILSSAQKRKNPRAVVGKTIKLGGEGADE
ncbi:MAG: glycosyltransferase [Pseudomonadota bacterium]